jgi:thiol-disulfide isomerase/thioredoxin
MYRHVAVWVAGFGLMTAAQAAPLAARVAALERQVAELQARLGGSSEESAAREEAALKLYREALELHRSGRSDQAEALVERVLAEFQGTKTAGSAQRFLTEMRVVGIPLTSLAVQRWLHGEGSLEHRATLLVFWEVWCPHCVRELPQLQERYADLRAQGIEVLAFTSLTRDKTDLDVAAFVKQHGIEFPIAVPEESLPDLLQISGIPAMAVVKGGVVVWRGHPAQLDDELLAAWAAP